MKNTALPPPIQINIDEFDTLEHLTDYIYKNHFKQDFMDKNKRSKLFGKFIYLDLDFLDYKPEKFWHIISFNANDEKYTVNPCINAEDIVFCKRKKPNCEASLFLPLDSRLDGRSECIYRMRRLNFINPILNLANTESEYVSVWSEDSTTKELKPIRKVYIRYQDDLQDYLIVLVDGEIVGKASYKFVTAYPVVHNGTKRRLDRSYINFNKKSRSQHC